MTLSPSCHPWPYLALHSYCLTKAFLYFLWKFTEHVVEKILWKSREKRDKSARIILVTAIRSFYVYDVSRV
jgi:hypothetical protein